MLVGELLGLELLAGDGFTTGEFRGDVLAVEGLDDLANIVVLHGVDVLEEGNEVDELLVVSVALPGIKDDGVLGLVADVLGVAVDDDHLLQITVEVREVLGC